MIYETVQVLGEGTIIKIIKKIFKWWRPTHKPTHSGVQPVIYARTSHSISRENIDKNALKVLYRLKNAGYAAYLVGGGVRDLLLGLAPKDFDIATDALPEDVQKLFRNCRLIGRRFRLAHIYFKEGIVEVATFRAGEESAVTTERHKTATGMIVRDNVYGNLEDDVFRRDFTVNALYYNVADFSVVDYTGGMIDVQQRVLRMIGDPQQRYQEDPIRMLRAIRLAAKLNFSIEAHTGQKIHELGNTLFHVPSARLYEEIIKLYSSGKALAAFKLLEEYQLYPLLFPQTKTCLDDPKNTVFQALIKHALINADERTALEKTLNPAFLFAVLLWQPYQEQIQTLIAEGMSAFMASQTAINTVLKIQLETLAIPRRITTLTREIWAMQARFQRRTRKQVYYTLQHPRFRAAFDFLLLRVEAGEAIQDLGEWWTKIQAADETQRIELLKQVPVTPHRGRRRRK